MKTKHIVYLLPSLFLFSCSDADMCENVTGSLENVWASHDTKKTINLKEKPKMYINLSYYEYPKANF